MRSKRIGVLGSINCDSITQPDGSIGESFGGVLYSAYALAYIGRGSWETLVLARVGEDILAELGPVLEGPPGIRDSGLLPRKQPNYRIKIEYEPSGEKHERLIGDMGAASFNELSPHLGQLDGLVLNFITGFELKRATLETIRSRYRFPLLMDFHSLTLGRNRDGSRFWKRPDDWEAWIRLVDVIQMNEDEAALIGEFNAQDARARREFARHLLDLGPSAAIITLGEKGVFAVNTVDDDCREHSIPADQPHRSVDPTGCGDVFLGALTAGIVGFGFTEFETALALANSSAGLKSRNRGLDALDLLASNSEADRPVCG